MRFTFFVVLLPFLLFGLQFVLKSPGNPLPFGVGITVLLTVWFWCGLPATLLYWLVRVARRAWRDGSTPAASAPESGRIFGRLS